jgi:hypothetical protein
MSRITHNVFGHARCGMVDASLFMPVRFGLFLAPALIIYYFLWRTKFTRTLIQFHSHNLYLIGQLSSRLPHCCVSGNLGFVGRDLARSTTGSSPRKRTKASRSSEFYRQASPWCGEKVSGKKVRHHGHGFLFFLSNSRSLTYSYRIHM